MEADSISGDSEEATVESLDLESSEDWSGDEVPEGDSSEPCLSGQYRWRDLNVPISDVCPRPGTDYLCSAILYSSMDVFPLIYAKEQGTGVPTPLSLAVDFIDLNFAHIGSPIDLVEHGNDNSSFSANVFQDKLLLDSSKISISDFILSAYQFSNDGNITLRGIQSISPGASGIQQLPVWTGSEYDAIYRVQDGEDYLVHVSRYSESFELLDDITIEPSYRYPLPEDVHSYSDYLYWMTDHFVRIENIYFMDGTGGYFASHWDIEAGQLDEPTLIDFQMNYTFTMFDPQLWNGEHYIILFDVVVPHEDYWDDSLRLIMLDGDFSTIGDVITLIEEPSVVYTGNLPTGTVIWNGWEYMVRSRSRWYPTISDDQTKVLLARFDGQLNKLQEWVYDCVSNRCPHIGIGGIFSTDIFWIEDRYVTEKPCPGNIEEDCLDYLICEE